MDTWSRAAQMSADLYQFVSGTYFGEIQFIPLLGKMAFRAKARLYTNKPQDYFWENRPKSLYFRCRHRQQSSNHERD